MKKGLKMRKDLRDELWYVIREVSALTGYMINFKENEDGSNDYSTIIKWETGGEEITPQKLVKELLDYEIYSLNEMYEDYPDLSEEFVTSCKEEIKRLENLIEELDKIQE